ncbi:4a-hydroxytetrahydrobiopterin dehydratase [Acidihalobacter prosperus]|uniref:Uncharacterized protein n=1 Tax=Acidihalobacter prosperus TaxID=160660 RepID=A0A1A6C0K3_9GAMM|nr:4a-hydroxytetrahydrobiopterin dehydratase [Acidihalobacter prosperus]OBS08092.1 hypothetical protein Thpro_022342 [Acidihalobacter prosperus]
MSMTPPEGWAASNTGTAAWFKRFEFSDYARLRRFLDDLAALAEETGVHPDNIGFGRDYVNVTLEAPAETGHDSRQGDFAQRLDRLSEQG